MQVIFGGFSHIGNIRLTNQDSLFMKHVQMDNIDLCFGVICDGVGGLENGEIASIRAVLSLRQWFDACVSAGIQEYDQYRSGLYNCIINLNHQISDYANKVGIRTGTTVSSILIYQNRFFIVHIGDSRIYKVVNEMYQLTQDHAVTKLQVSGSQIAEKKLLTQCIGYRDEVKIFCNDGWLHKGDSYLLCSDGFYAKMNKSEIPRLLRHVGLKTDLDNLAKKLAMETMRRQERDNISIGIIKIF